MTTLQPEHWRLLRATLTNSLATEERIDESSFARARILKRLVDRDLDRLPLPGKGETLERWRMLGEVAAFDLSLVKLFEGHTDAHAIMRELDAPAAPPGSTWGMWAAEAPPDRVIATPSATQPGVLTLRGVKRWCSGAEHLSHGLLTVWTEGATEPWLAAVQMDQPCVSTSGASWCAVGMRASGSIDLSFDGATATAIGRPGDYLRRPGFWHGGAGIAACWHAAAAALAGHLLTVAAIDDPPWHRTLALGQLDVALGASASALREAAAAIDRTPTADARLLAIRTRAIAEQAVIAAQSAVTRAMGAAPLCRDAWFARMAADLPVFVRQSHGDRDLAALGELLARDRKEAPWQL